jgi:TIR domain
MSVAQPRELHKASIFISYARQDRLMAHRLWEDLRAAHLDAWIDVENIKPGQNWKHEISKAIRHAEYFVIVLSHSAKDHRGYFQKEIREALEIAEERPEGEIFLIPARIEDCLVPHHKLEALQWVNLFPSYEAGLTQLISVMESRPCRNEAPPRAHERTDNDEILRPTGPVARILELSVRYLRIVGSMISEPKQFLGRHDEASRDNLIASLEFAAISMIPFSTFNALFPLGARQAFYHFIGYAFISGFLMLCSIPIIQLSWRMVGGRASWRQCTIVTLYYTGIVLLIGFIVVLLAIGMLKALDRNVLLLVRDAAGGNLWPLIRVKPLHNQAFVGAAIVLALGEAALSVWTFFFWGAYREINGTTKGASFVAWALSSIFLVPAGIAAVLLQEALFNFLKP